MASYNDKLINYLQKNKNNIPCTSPLIYNPEFETRLVSYSNIILSDSIFIDKVPSSISDITFSFYYTCDYQYKNVYGRNVSDSQLTNENYAIDGTISAANLYATSKLFTVEIWEEILKEKIGIIYTSINYPHILKIEKLKLDLVYDTYNTKTPCYYNIVLKDSLIGYGYNLYGVNSLYPESNPLDITNYDIGQHQLTAETGIIQILEPECIITIGNNSFKIFNDSSDSADSALFNKVKSPYITFYKYIGEKTLESYAKLSDLPTDIIVKYSSNIIFYYDAMNTIGTKIRSTDVGGVYVEMNEGIDTYFDVSGKVKANEVISTRITLATSVGKNTMTQSFQAIGQDLYYSIGNVGIGSAIPVYTLDVYGTTQIAGSSKISIQGGNDGGSAQGIYMWAEYDKDWGIYMASSGSSSLGDGSASIGYFLEGLALRFRAHKDTIGSGTGFIWENSAEEALMSLNTNGDLWIKGTTNFTSIELGGYERDGGIWLGLSGSQNSPKYGAFYNGLDTGSYGLISTSIVNDITDLQWGIKIIRDGSTSLFYSGSNIERLKTTELGVEIRDIIKVGDHTLIQTNDDTVLSINKAVSTNSGSYIQIYSDGCSGYDSYNGLLFGMNGANVELINNENGYMRINNNGTDSIFINSLGYVGINTTALKNDNVLDVNGNLITKSVYTSNNDSNGGLWIATNSNLVSIFSGLINSSNNDFGLLTSVSLNKLENEKWFLTANNVSNNLKLYYDNDSKLETQDYGVLINGDTIMDNLTLHSNLILGNRLSINTTTNKLSLYINSNDAIKIPVGTTQDRPLNPENGYVRYNSDISSYEGYVNGSWKGLGGLSDLDENTYIIAETSPGANNNELEFYTNGIQSMIINSYQNVGIGTSQPNYKLDVIGTVHISSTLNVENAVSLSNILNIKGITTLQSNLIIGGSNSIIGTLNVLDSISTSNLLNVYGITTLQNNLYVNGSNVVLGTLQV